MNGATLLSFIVLTLFFCLTHTKETYNGYSVLRVELEKEREDEREHESGRSTQVLLRLTSHIDADVWFVNREYAHVMVDEQQAVVLRKHFNTSVHIPSVQKLIEESEAEMSAKKNVQDIFSSFPTWGEVLVWVNQQATAHPDKARVINLGNTYDGENIVGLQLGDSTKRIIYIHCTIHAREWITTTTCLWIIDNLLNTDTQLLSLFQWVIIPVLNIDGYDYSHTTSRLWRKNRQLNSGSTCVGTDLNRNYAYGFGGSGSSSSPCSDTFRGLRAFSAPETFAEQRYLESVFPSVAAYVDIHAYGGQWMSPWGYTTVLPPDYPQMLSAMEEVTEAIRAVNGRSYEYGSSARVIYVAAGGSDDQAYGNGGVVYSFTVEAAGTSFTPSVDSIKPIGRELYAGVKQLATYINQLGY